MRAALRAAETKAATIPCIAVSSSAWGTGQPASKARAEGATVVQGFSPAARGPGRLAQGSRAEALRPGWARRAACDRHHMGECRFVVIGVEAKTAMADPAARLHARRLDHDKTGAGKPESAQVLDMPIGGRAILGAVLAHRRDNDPVRQG